MHGAPQYKPNGDVYLVFVRERSNLNEWQYLWSKAFPGDSDVEPSQPVEPSTSALQDVCDMADSQATAKFVALEKLGYKVPTQPGVVIQEMSDVPAATVLRCDDVVLSVDGKPTNTPDELRAIVSSHKPGDVAAVTFERGGHRMTRSVKLVKDSSSGDTVIGLYPAQQYIYPLQLGIDTADIGGPSAGLAMTLAILDQLTKGNLTGGKKVAVTGTINPDGTVGEIGEIQLEGDRGRALVARRSSSCLRARCRPRRTRVQAGSRRGPEERQGREGDPGEDARRRVARAPGERRRPAPRGHVAEHDLREPVAPGAATPYDPLQSQWSQPNAGSANREFNGRTGSSRPDAECRSAGARGRQHEGLLERVPRPQRIGGAQFPAARRRRAVARTRPHRRARARA